MLSDLPRCAPPPSCHDSLGSNVRFAYGLRFVRETPATTYSDGPTSEYTEPPTNDCDAICIDGTSTSHGRFRSYSIPARPWRISLCGPYQPTQPVQSPAEYRTLRSVVD